MKAAIDRLPCFAAIVSAKCTGRRDRDEDPIRISRIDNDAVQAHAAGAGLPVRPGAVTAQSGKLVPCLPAVGGTEQCGIFNAGVNRVRIRRAKVRDARLV